MALAVGTGRATDRAIQEIAITVGEAMVPALLDGRKTQVRYAIKPQPEDIRSPAHPEESARFGQSTFGMVRIDGSDWEPLHCPYGQPDARLLVRETYGAFGRWETRYSPGKKREEWHFSDMTIASGLAYRFDIAGLPRGSYAPEPGWHRRPARSMPRAASRVVLEVINVRIGRLHDINEADATAEGVTMFSDNFINGLPGWEGFPEALPRASARDAYIDHWDSLNDASGYGWDLNPWVWVIEFLKVST